MIGILLLSAAAPFSLKVCAAGYVNKLEYHMHDLDGKMPYVQFTVDQTGFVEDRPLPQPVTMRIGFDDRKHQNERWDMTVKSLSDAFNNRIPISVKRINPPNNFICEAQTPIVGPEIEIDWCSNESQCKYSTSPALDK